MLDPVSLRESLEGRLTDSRKARGKRHPLPSLVPVMAAGAAAALTGPLAVAQAAAGWDQEVLAAHGCWTCPRTGLRASPSASMLGRLARLLDADELEAALSAAVAALRSIPRSRPRTPRTARSSSGEKRNGGRREAEAEGRGEIP